MAKIANSSGMGKKKFVNEKKETSILVKEKNKNWNGTKGYVVLFVVCNL